MPWIWVPSSWVIGIADLCNNVLFFCFWQGAVWLTWDFIKPTWLQIYYFFVMKLYKSTLIAKLLSYSQCPLLQNYNNNNKHQKTTRRTNKHQKTKLSSPTQKETNQPIIKPLDRNPQSQELLQDFDCQQTLLYMYAPTLSFKFTEKFQDKHKWK